MLYFSEGFPLRQFDWIFAVPCFVGALALTAFNCSTFAALGFMRFSAFSEACFSLTCFGVMSISVAIEAPSLSNQNPF